MEFFYGVNEDDNSPITVERNQSNCLLIGKKEQTQWVAKREILKVLANTNDSVYVVAEQFALDCDSPMHEFDCRTNGYDNQSAMDCDYPVQEFGCRTNGYDNTDVAPDSRLHLFRVQTSPLYFGDVYYRALLLLIRVLSQKMKDNPNQKFWIYCFDIDSAISNGKLEQLMASLFYRKAEFENGNPQYNLTFSAELLENLMNSSHYQKMVRDAEMKVLFPVIVNFSFLKKQFQISEDYQFNNPMSGLISVGENRFVKFDLK